MLTKINTLKQHNGLKNPSRYLKNIAVSQIVVMRSFDRIEISNIFDLETINQ